MTKAIFMMCMVIGQVEPPQQTLQQQATAAVNELPGVFSSHQAGWSSMLVYVENTKADYDVKKPGMAGGDKATVDAELATTDGKIASAAIVKMKAEKARDAASVAMKLAMVALTVQEADAYFQEAITQSMAAKTWITLANTLTVQAFAAATEAQDVLNDY